MIVVDASAWVYALIDPGAAGDDCRSAMRSHRSWVAPAHMPTEALRTVRRFETAGLVSQPKVDEIVEEIVTAAFDYQGPDPSLLAAQWKLRHNLSAYDAPYVVLGRKFRSPLITLDGRLARAAMTLGVEVRHVNRD